MAGAPRPLDAPGARREIRGPQEFGDFRNQGSDAAGVGYVYLPYDVHGNLLREGGKPIDGRACADQMKTALPDRYMPSRHWEFVKDEFLFNDKWGDPEPARKPAIESAIRSFVHRQRTSPCARFYGTEMDESDLKLCLLLSAEPRAPYRDLADRLGVSVQAVHRRIQDLRERGIIRGFTANISMGYLGAVRVDVVGQTQSESMKEVLSALAKNDRVVTTLEASGRLLYVNGVLRDASELDDFVGFVRRAAAMPSPAVAIEAGGPWVPRGGRPASDSRELSPLDIRIIRSLHSEARKSTTDVATELGVSAATVRRRLDAMIRDRTIEFMTDIDPARSGGVSSILALTLDERVDRLRLGAHLVEKYRPDIVYFIPFGNLPNHLVCATWTQTAAELHTLVARVEGEDGVKKAVANIAVAGYHFENWRDKLLENPERATGRMRASST